MAGEGRPITAEKAHLRIKISAGRAMRPNRSVNRIQRIAHSTSLDHLFDELISECEKRVSLLRPFGRHGQAEQELRNLHERRSLIDSFRSDHRLPASFRDQITDLELLRLRSLNSHFGRMNQSYLVAAMQKLFAEAEVIRVRVAKSTTEVHSSAVAVNS